LIWGLLTVPTILGKLFEGRQPVGRVRLSNNVPEFSGDELSYGPAAVKMEFVWALFDTGATNSAIHSAIQSDFMLNSQSTKRLMTPEMTAPEFRPVFPIELHFCETPKDTQSLIEWPDLLDVLTFNLSNRHYKAVIGMDVLQKGKLEIDGNGSVQFSFWILLTCLLFRQARKCLARCLIVTGFVNPPIFEALAWDTFQRFISARSIAKASGFATIIAKIKFAEIAL